MKKKCISLVSLRVIGIILVLIPQMPRDIKTYHLIEVVIPMPHVFLLPCILENSRFPSSFL